MMRRAISGAAITSTTVLLVGSLCAVPGLRADGMLDPSFGNGGLVVTAFPGASSQDRALSLVVLPDGRAVAAGYTNLNLAQTDMAVARYLSSGELDTTFGGDGQVTIPFPQTGGSYSTAEEVLLQADGRLVLVGSTLSDFGGSFALARLMADGSLDPSFGSGGRVTVPADEAAKAGLLQPDGRIIAMGSGANGSIVVARYNPDGSLDPTFDGDGTVTVPGSFVEIQGAALQPDGRIVIAGTSQTGGLQTRNFALVRLLPDGALDGSFDGDGIVVSDFAGVESGYSVIVLGDGRLVLAGSRGTDVAVARYLPDGSLDTSFGNGGLAIVDVSPSESAHQLIELPNGNLLVAGATYDPFDPLDFLLVRLLPNGSLDTTFGTGGFLTTDFNGGPDECNAVAVAGPDLLLTAGATGDFPSDFGLARYIATIPVELLDFEVQ
jgi:uncharacterized delta-60 repeat protein